VRERRSLARQGRSLKDAASRVRLWRVVRPRANQILSPQIQIRNPNRHRVVVASLSIAPTSPGEEIADVWLVTSVALLLMLVAWGDCVYSDRYVRPGVLGALLLGAAAALAAYDGITLAVREYARAHNGQVTAGVVVAKTSATGLERKEGTPGRRWWRPRVSVTTEGFRPHDILGRVILTGSLRAWIIEYQYDCERPRGCRDRDFVPEAQWRSLYAGQTIDVRRSSGETDSSRLDENPQWKRATTDVAIAGALLLAAGAVSGRLTRRRPRYLIAPAVVTSIQPVKTHDITRWKLTFAYFDSKGMAHEGADEVLISALKAGDEGLAVFPPDRPDLATFRPPKSA
jgi:hypothetical protein